MFITNKGCMLVDDAVQILTLVKGCCREDRNCQGEVYRWLYGYALKICYRYTNHQQEAEELTNESFVKLFKNIHLSDAGRQLNTEALFKAWFKQIIISTCIDYARKHYAVMNGLTHPGSEPVTGIQEPAVDKLSYEEIIEAIKQLPPICRTVFNLFVIEGMSHREIARQLHISVGASKSSLSKARHQLGGIISKQTRYNTYVQAG